MFTTENHVGRLVELRVASPFDLGQLQDLQACHLGLIGGLDEFVSAVDLRRAHVFPPPITAVFIGMMSHVNPRLVRSAILVSESATLSLQAERAIEEAGSPNRRAFREVSELVEWLGEVLRAEELERLELFLGEV